MLFNRSPTCCQHLVKLNQDCSKAASARTFGITIVPEMLNMCSHNEHFREHNKHLVIKRTATLQSYRRGQQLTQLSKNLWRNCWGSTLRLVVDKVFPSLKGKKLFTHPRNKKGKERGEGKKKQSAEGGTAGSRCKVVPNTWSH